MFRIQGVAHLMPSLKQLAEIHVLDLRVAHREDAANATAPTHGMDVFDNSDETPAWESAFPAHWDRRNLNARWVHRAIYISPQGPSGIALTMSITSCAQFAHQNSKPRDLRFITIWTSIPRVSIGVAGISRSSITARPIVRRAHTSPLPLSTYLLCSFPKMLISTRLRRHRSTP